MFVCPFVTYFSDFYEEHMRRLHPLFPLVAFQLGFFGIPEKLTKKLRNHHQRNDPAGPRFGIIFCYFFLKSFVFFLEGLVRVEHLVLARILRVDTLYWL